MISVVGTSNVTIDGLAIDASQNSARRIAPLRLPAFTFTIPTAASPTTPSPAPGLSGLPFQSMYSASKFAMEGWTKSLRFEVSPFGIRVVLIEPGDVKTGFTGSRVRAARSTASSAYNESFSKCMGIVEKEEQKGVPPESIARLVSKIVEANAKGPRYTWGAALQRLSAFLKRCRAGGRLSSRARLVRERWRA